MAEIITSDDVLGKGAVDPDGSVLGVVTKVHIDKGNMSIVGITIDTGFARPDLYVGIDNVRTFGKDAVLLKKVPASKFKGIAVLTSEGKELRKVVDVVMKNSNIDEFVVKTSWFFGRKFKVKNAEIKKFGENIILKENFEKK